MLRKNVCLESGNAFITGTAGCASFPSDADNFSDLFKMIDKTLYFGKRKGRNCYTIYLEEKHRDLEISKLAKHNIYSDMINLQKHFIRGSNIREKLSFVLGFLSDCLQISDLYYCDRDDRLRSVNDPDLDIDISDITVLTKEEVYAASSISDMEKTCPLLYRALKGRDIESNLIVRIGNEVITEGYLICGVNRRFRIWQENECALMYYLSTLIFSFLRNH